MKAFALCDSIAMMALSQIDDALVGGPLVSRSQPFHVKALTWSQSPHPPHSQNNIFPPNIADYFPRFATLVLEAQKECQRGGLSASR